mgnify:FL=1
MIADRQIFLWLLSGVFMLLLQIILGGITRLTGSGLSITRWDIITGIIYPLSDVEWMKAFDMYKQTPQYSKINHGISLGEFKFIYFWEYFHRLWARLMGLVFVIPFLYFLIKGRLSRKLIYDLLIVVVLAVFVASLGWIMVASGLVHRPWVNAYKLSFHLCAAVLLIGFLWWTALCYGWSHKRVAANKTTVNLIRILIGICFVQIFLGGVMSGMKAGIAAPTWPDMGGHWLPLGIDEISEKNWSLFGDYDQDVVNPLVIQFFHRNVAYVVFAISLFAIFYSFRIRQRELTKRLVILLALLTVQIGLGIITILNCVGYVPLLWGVLHQLTGIICFLYILYLVFLTKAVIPLED